VDPLKIDAVLSMLDLDELHEALETVDRWEEQGNLSHDEAETWRARIDAWSAAGGTPADSAARS